MTWNDLEVTQNHLGVVDTRHMGYYLEYLGSDVELP